MIIIDDWRIDADSRCYTIFKSKQRVTKDGKVEDYRADVKYYSTLAAALTGIIRAERKNIVQSREMSLQEAIKLINEADARLLKLFENLEE